MKIVPPSPKTAEGWLSVLTTLCKAWTLKETKQKGEGKLACSNPWEVTESERGTFQVRGTFMGEVLSYPKSTPSRPTFLKALFLNDLVTSG